MFCHSVDLWMILWLPICLDGILNIWWCFKVMLCQRRTPQRFCTQNHKFHDDSLTMNQPLQVWPTRFSMNHSKSAQSHRFSRARCGPKNAHQLVPRIEHECFRISILYHSRFTLTLTHSYSLYAGVMFDIWIQSLFFVTYSIQVVITTLLPSTSSAVHQNFVTGNTIECRAIMTVSYSSLTSGSCWPSSVIKISHSKD